MATHGIFSGNSVEIVKDNSDFIQKIVVSNTVPQSSNEAFLPKHLHVLDVSGNFSLFDYSLWDSSEISLKHGPSAGQLFSIKNHFFLSIL